MRLGPKEEGARRNALRCFASVLLSARREVSSRTNNRRGNIWRSSSGPNCLDSLTARYASGGTSTLLFKACEQGRAKWQGDTLHGVWFDQEPPLDIYTEGLTRTNATDGIVMRTFTPLKGMSEVVRMYLADRIRSPREAQGYGF